MLSKHQSADAINDKLPPTLICFLSFQFFGQLNTPLTISNYALLSLLVLNTILRECNCSTWSQSSSSIVPFMFLKNSVNWLPFFLSASDAATPAYISTAARYEKTWIHMHVSTLHKFQKLNYHNEKQGWTRSHYVVYQEVWIHISHGKLNQNSSPQESQQFYISSCMPTANKSLLALQYISDASMPQEKIVNVKSILLNQI